MNHLTILTLIALLLLPINATARMSAVMVGGGVSGAAEEIGYTSVAGTALSQNANYIICTQATAVHTGTIDKIFLYTSSSSATVDTEVGIYNDSSGAPGTLVAAATTFLGSATWSAGWKEFSPVSYSVTASNVYWICSNINESSVVTRYYDDPGGTTQYYYFVANTFGDAWPSPMTGPGHSTIRHSFKARVTY